MRLGLRRRGPSWKRWEVERIVPERHTNLGPQGCSTRASTRPLKIRIEYSSRRTLPPAASTVRRSRSMNAPTFRRQHATSVQTSLRSGSGKSFGWFALRLEHFVQAPAAATRLLSSVGNGAVSMRHA